MDLGTVWQRTRQAYGSVPLRTIPRRQRTRQAYGSVPLRTIPRRQRRSTEDRYGRRLGLSNPEGLAYEPCVACQNRSMVRHRQGCRTFYGDHWHCESCTYADTELKSLV